MTPQDSSPKPQRPSTAQQSQHFPLAVGLLSRDVGGGKQVKARPCMMQTNHPHGGSPRQEAPCRIWPLDGIRYSPLSNPTTLQDRASEPPCPQVLFPARSTGLDQGAVFPHMQGGAIPASSETAPGTRAAELAAETRDCSVLWKGEFPPRFSTIQFHPCDAPRPAGGRRGNTRAAVKGQGGEQVHGHRRREEGAQPSSVASAKEQGEIIFLTPRRTGKD